MYGNIGYKTSFNICYEQLVNSVFAYKNVYNMLDI